jgi:hypothetical protein
VRCWYVTTGRTGDDWEELAGRLFVLAREGAPSEVDQWSGGAAATLCNGATEM